MSELDVLFKEINSMPLTAKVPVDTRGANLKVHNELPLISQSIANAIATVAWGISSPRGQQNIQKTIENSVQRKFLPYVNSMAMANKKSLHHVYEWNKVGVTSARLFDLVIPSTSRGKANFSMRLEFRPSRSLVPLTEAQATPGPSGQVVERKHVFYNKAMIMEYGDKVVVRPKNTKYMAFDTPPGGRKTLSGLTFSSRPVTIDYSKMQTSHGLNAAISSYFKTVGDKEAEKSVKKYSRSVARGARKSAHMITVHTPSDAYANSVAARITNALVPNNG